MDQTVPTEGTYTTVARPHQLKRGDQYTEEMQHMDKPDRSVTVQFVTHGQLTYRGLDVPVFFVTAVDNWTKGKVIYSRTSWDFMSVTRTGTVNQPLPPAAATFTH
jgi:hypothetical protein